MADFYSEKKPDTAVLQAFILKNKLPIRDFGNREVILSETDSTDTFCIILSGGAFLSGINENGKRSIIDFFAAGDIAGRFMFPPSSKTSYFFLNSTKNARVCFISYEQLLKYCNDDAAAAKEIISHLIFSTYTKQNTHSYILGQRTLSEKLMLFFENLSTKCGSESFSLPMNYTNLADYLAVDRSAMMRELKKLNSNGIIKSDKQKITLLHKITGE